MSSSNKRSPTGDWFSPFYFSKMELEDFELDIFLDCESRLISKKADEILKKYRRRREKNAKSFRSKNVSSKLKSKPVEIGMEFLSDLVDEKIIHEANLLGRITSQWNTTVWFNPICRVSFMPKGL